MPINPNAPPKAYLRTVKRTTFVNGCLLVVAAVPLALIAAVSAESLLWALLAFVAVFGTGMKRTPSLERIDSAAPNQNCC
jgi:hypothetical protein